MTDETTSEQLAEIEGQGELITGPGLYQARCGDLVQITRWRAGWWVSEWKGIRTDYHSDGRKRLRTEADAGRWDLLHWVAPLPASEPEPETTTEQPAEIEGQGESTPVTEYTPPEGWRLVRFGELLLPGDEIVQIDDGRRYPTHRIGDAVGPNQQYIRRIKPEPQAESHTEQQIEELRSEVSYVQRLLGESRQRVTQLEELVASLRTINRGCENAVRDAGKENLALKNQLEAVKAELTSVAADRQKLQIELDAAQQVPPAIADRFKEGWNQGTARAVETVLEWLEPVRLVDSAYLANATMQHLPQIMRHLTGLDSHAID